MTWRLKGPLALGAGAVAMGLAATGAPAQDKWSYPVEVWDPPFDMASPRTTVEYEPLDKAAQKWDLCVSFPHMKDAYWMAVDYGVVDEAAREGVRMQLVEAGGYTNLNTQISQIEDCVARGADAVIIGAISLDGLNNLVSEIRKILHTSGQHNIALFGAGNLGQAIASSDIFADHGFRIVAIFDSDPEVVGKEFGGVPVRALAELPQVVREDEVVVGV